MGSETRRRPRHEHSSGSCINPLWIRLQKTEGGPCCPLCVLCNVYASWPCWLGGDPCGGGGSFLQLRMQSHIGQVTAQMAEVIAACNNLVPSQVPLAHRSCARAAAAAFAVGKRLRGQEAASQLQPMPRLCSTPTQAGAQLEPAHAPCSHQSQSGITDKRPFSHINHPEQAAMKEFCCHCQVCMLQDGDSWKVTGVAWLGNCKQGGSGVEQLPTRSPAQPILAVVLLCCVVTSLL
ncbi:hypothetical protein V8C86DRAFT_3026248 [Haematococcus lacustris]